MYFPSSTSLLFSLFFIFSCTNAFNITSMLKDHKDFSTFNDYLTRTKLAEEINNRQSLTVFVVDNGAISSLTGGNSLDTVKKVLSLHVALEYFDGPKLNNLPKDEPTILTTLLQANGQSTGQQGFLKATMGGDNGGGAITISSASSPDQKATIGKSVASQPYNISVIQISNAIVPNIISPPTGAPTKLPSPPPSKSPKPPNTLPGEGSPDLAPGGSGTVDGPTTAASPDSPSSSAGTKMVSVNCASFVISVAALMCTNLLRVRLP